MKITETNRAATIENNFDPDPWDNNGPADCWRVIWDSGTTEEGSSGSPLFNESRRIIGQLYGGTADCSKMNGHDNYGRFHLSWSGGGTDATRLSNWLAPGLGNSAPNFLNGRYPPVISGSTPICSGSSKNFSASNWISGDYYWDKSSNLSLSSTTSPTTTVSPANSSSYGTAWVSVKSQNTGAVLATFDVWIGIPDPFLYLLIEGQDGLYPPGWYITNYITACPLQFIALYPKYYEPAGVLEFQGQSSNISGIKFTSPTSITSDFLTSTEIKMSPIYTEWSD